MQSVKQLPTNKECNKAFKKGFKKGSKPKSFDRVFFSYIQHEQQQQKTSSGEGDVMDPDVTES